MYWFFQVRFHFILKCFPFPFDQFHLKHISAAQQLKLCLCKISDYKTLERSLGIQPVVDYSWHLTYENTTLFFSLLPLGSISSHGSKSFVICKMTIFLQLPYCDSQENNFTHTNCNRLHLYFTKHDHCPQR